MEKNKEVESEENRPGTWSAILDRNKELEDNYVRLYAEFENYKKRYQKDKEELITRTKLNTLSSVLEIDSDLSIALGKIKNDESKIGINIIISKLEKFLKSQGIESIQTETYDPDLHEVITVLETGDNKIVDVISKGYTMNGKPFKYPKIVISK